MPKTAEALRALDGTVDLDIDLEGLALLGTLFDETQVITRNHAALVQGRGGYAGFQQCGAAWKANKTRINMRVFGTREPLILRNNSQADLRLPAAISVVSADGEICHRVQFFSDMDWLTAQTADIRAEARAVPPPCAPAQPNNVISLATVRRARAQWGAAHLGDHLDDLIIDQGQTRARSLCYIGRAHARRVTHAYLPSFLSFLCRRRVKFSASVPAEGLIQTLCGQGQSCFGDAKGIMTCHTDQGIFSLDLPHVAEAWVTRHSFTAATRFGAALELYDREGRALAVLHADPWSEGATWNSYLEAIPSY
ncbi:hypothetical protein [Celeribacter sp.]|uniref:hypothetical protein n=1 Tax=Celeribacter sp. TaxID=1890673 RepID=UPI003A94474F